MCSALSNCACIRCVLHVHIMHMTSFLSNVADLGLKRWLKIYFRQSWPTLWEALLRGVLSTRLILYGLFEIISYYSAGVRIHNYSIAPVHLLIIISQDCIVLFRWWGENGDRSRSNTPRVDRIWVNYHVMRGQSSRLTCWFTYWQLQLLNRLPKKTVSAVFYYSATYFILSVPCCLPVSKQINK